MILFLFGFILSQNPGTAEVHPKITWQKCTKSGCTNQQGGIVIDSEWRDVVDSTGKDCSDWSCCENNEATCSSNTYLNGFDYSTVGVSTSGSSVRLNFVTPAGEVGSRVYLYDETAKQYVLFKPLNKEFTFDIDTATLACGINGALYFVEMDVDGGTKKYPRNTAGAEYGTGYCDAQCPKDGKFIGNNANLGRKYGSCCFEWDIWEANAYSTQFAAHPCDVNEAAHVCEGGCGLCDSGGCGWNHYKNGDQKLYGQGLAVNTNSKFTVVTQFITDSGTDSGTLKEVRRLYVQNGKVIQNNVFSAWDSDKGGNTDYDSISGAYCTKAAYDQAYDKMGGNSAWSKSFQRGQVVAMSIWTDGSMSWLDSGNAGPCPSSSPGTANLVSQNKNAFVEFSNIKFGDIDSTY